MLSIEHNYSLYKHSQVYLISCWEKKGISYFGVVDRLSIFCEVNNSYACWILETRLYWARSCECYYEEVEVELLSVDNFKYKKSNVMHTFNKVLYVYKHGRHQIFIVRLEVDCY